jgi:hypothetical protein
MSVGGLAISSDVAVGTAASGVSGDMWTADSFTSDQYSQITVTSASMSGTQWIAAVVRAQNGGASSYVGLYGWNNGNPVLDLFLWNGGSWTALGSWATGGALAAGTVLELSAQGSSLSFTENGVRRISASDSTLTGGAPGIMAYETTQAGSWAGGDAVAFPVGGTVSGLSGSGPVVLQDNGGDSVSVSGNGSFTFPTPVVAGAPYDATVKTYPPGETCSVADGSGTVASAAITDVAVTCSAGTATSASDDFDRADGSLGPNWTATTDGSMTITSDQAVGANAYGNSGDMWTADSFTSDQYSQIEVSATALSGTQWVGPAVRLQDGGLDGYVGIYYWNNGSPELEVFLRDSGSWTEIGRPYSTGGPLPAGTQLQLSATGSAITFYENGQQVITADDTTFTGGAPGILANGTSPATDWSGGDIVPGNISIGGTVSGLTVGDVVLQDNGVDTINVSNDGSFTFPTLLTPGAAYDVTVETYPSGQICSVANGSGTVSSSDVTNVTVTCSVSSATSGSDYFGQADESLEPDWTATTDGSMTITSDQAVGTSASGISGDIWTGDSFTSDQYSEVVVSSTQLTGSQWIGAAVRAQDGGQDAYVGLYYWNNGSPELEVFLRDNGSWTALGGWSTGGALPAGTQLQLTVVGDSLSFTENGIQRVAVSDDTLAGGAPGIMAAGYASAAAWYGGNSGFQINYQSTDSSGIQYYTILSSNDGHGPQTLRVLQPTDPAPGVAHNFLIVLPVEPGLGNTFGDGLQTMQSLNAQNQYNLTIVEPTFEIDPWYADNPTDAHLQYETFLTQELVPWMKQNLAITGNEQVWLIGFSKSGIGGQDLILKHPDIFTLAASWDFPADMSSYDQYSDSAASYGTDANFQDNYRLTPAFVQAHAAPFEEYNRIWIGGYALYGTDMTDYDALLTSEGVLHTTETPTPTTHSWTSGWVPGALAALYQDSINLPSGS